jgi:hypothetical protein
MRRVEFCRRAGGKRLRGGRDFFADAKLLSDV